MKQEFKEELLKFTTQSERYAATKKSRTSLWRILNGKNKKESINTISELKKLLDKNKKIKSS